MKTLKLTVLLLLMLIISSCTGKDEGKEEIEQEQGVEDECIGLIGLDGSGYYDLFLSFQDASGNDLLEGIEYNILYVNNCGDTMLCSVKNELYTFEYVYPGTTWSPYNISFLFLIKGNSFSKRFSEINGNYDYLYFDANNGPWLEKKYALIYLAMTQCMKLLLGGRRPKD